MLEYKFRTRSGLVGISFCCEYFSHIFYISFATKSKVTNVTFLSLVAKSPKKKYNRFMEILWMCRRCHHEQMIDIGVLEKRPFDKIFNILGFTCCNCGGWEAVWYQTISLEAAMRKLERLPINRKDFGYHFAVTLRKAKGVQQRGLEHYGALVREYMVAAG